MKILDRLDAVIDKTFDTGDPEVRTWFLVKDNLAPFFLCIGYMITVTVIGPHLMKNRKPFTLRVPMIIFNFCLVVSYTVSVSYILFNLPTLGLEKFCYGARVIKGDITYNLTRFCWFLYILKYIEFIDTAFFILRKKMQYITFLHVIHHTAVPLLGWIMLRTETSGFQSIPVLLNGVVHIIMYAYYGLSAVGPHMKKYLWWKKHLTILQMVQFVCILLVVSIVAPLSGCNIMRASIVIDILCGGGFLMLFYNFYTKTFCKKKLA